MVGPALLVAALLFAPREPPARVAPDVIQRVVRAEHARMRGCYEAGLARQPKLAGRVVVRFEVGRRGTVTAATRHDATTLSDERVVSCVVSAFRALRFPETARPLTITYPIDFVPAVRDEG